MRKAIKTYYEEILQLTYKFLSIDLKTSLAVNTELPLGQERGKDNSGLSVEESSCTQKGMEPKTT